MLLYIMFMYIWFMPLTDKRKYLDLKIFPEIYLKICFIFLLKNVHHFPSAYSWCYCARFISRHKIFVIFANKMSSLCLPLRKHYLFSWCHKFKGILHPKLKIILSTFTQCHAVPECTFFLCVLSLFLWHKQRFLEK